MIYFAGNYAYYVQIKNNNWMCKRTIKQENNDLEYNPRILVEIFMLWCTNKNCGIG
jgi:hypothetical protein